MAITHVLFQPFSVKPHIPGTFLFKKSTMSHKRRFIVKYMLLKQVPNIIHNPRTHSLIIPLANPHISTPPTLTHHHLLLSHLPE